MPTLFSYLKGCVLVAASFGMLSAGSAKPEQWTDTQGKSFKAEAAEAVGPLALFRLPDKSGKLLPFRMLSPQDCARFARQVATIPGPAADWSQSKTAIGSEIFGCATRVQGERLVDVDLKGVPEPRFYVLFYANNGVSKSWDMLGKSKWAFTELQRNYPGMVEGFMFGVKHSAGEHRGMAANKDNPMPYLISYFDDQRKMDRIGQLIPSTGYGIVITNSGGVPLFFNRADTDESAKKIFADLAGILDLLKPSNPAAWADRLHYWMAAQPALHATDTCEPMLVGDPLNAEKLAQLGVKQFEATLFVSAGGAVTAVSMAPGGEIPEDLVQPITEALHQAQLVPAVDSGKFIAGKYHYRFGAK